MPPKAVEQLAQMVNYYYYVTNSPRLSQHITAHSQYMGNKNNLL